MFKHPIRAVSYAVLLFFALSYPIRSVAALALKATTGNQHITLQWGKVNGASNYGVCYASQPIVDINNCLNYTDGAWHDMTETTLKIANLSNGKKYYFRVLAENANGTMEVSNTITAIPNKASALNDTGITTCSDGASDNLPCPVEGYPHQDAQSGRDLSKNTDSNGHAGFDFTKISNIGTALAAKAKRWNCVKDNVTGLMWEVKTDDNGLHDKDWTYSWYEPDNSKNGGAAGYQNQGACGSTSACDTDAYVKAVNAAGWCGYKDWRMPGQAELQSIVDYSRYNPAIDATYFPNTFGAWFWSSSPDASSAYSAWIVYFYNGAGSVDLKLSVLAVRLVRGGQ